MSVSNKNPSINNQQNNKFLLNKHQLDEVLDLNFLDPGVSNGDVDWLFRGKEVKKLTKRSNTINNEVQSQIIQAQQKILAHSKGKESPNNSTNTSLNSNDNNSSDLNNNLKVSAIPIPSNSKRINSNSLKSSLKLNSPANNLKIDTSINSTPPHSLNESIISSSVSSHKSNISILSPSSSNSNSIQSPSNQTDNSQKNRSRSSSLLFSKSKSNSKSAEISKPKKSLLSTLSSKLKSSSNSNSPISPIKQNPKIIPSSTNSIRNTSPTNLVDSNNIKIKSSKKSINLSDSKLNNVPFKRVYFALDDLIEDPQQQIPSRRPKKGNVLIPEDMLAPPPKLSIGITNSFNQQTKDEKPIVDPKLYEQAIARQSFFLAESKKHSEEAHIAALRMAKEVSSFKKRKNSILSSNGSDDSDDDDEYENITDSKFLSGDETLDIDTPLHTHVDYFGDDSSNSNSNSNSENSSSEINLETLYTRCCHLREILPIPATLKQLKGKSKPLHIIKMLNPKPTLIDILSFSDFLAIAPIITIIFDNVTIDTEMLKIILISLKNSKMLDKLSLRNVPIDQNGWKFLCKFLKMNPNIQKLDISQQKIKKNSDNSKTIIRSELDWDLFIDTLISRGGIEELVIHGCCLNNKQFNNLVNKALILKTKRFGLASSQLDLEKMNILSNWISNPNSCCKGIDFAFNDLSAGQLTPINNVLDNKYSDIKLQFFSLNSTDIKLDECQKLIKNLSKIKSLRFLDLSNNPQLFPDILPVLRDYLPKFPDLRRLHFDFDNLSEVTIVQLCLLFQKCPRLVHVSFLGNKKITLNSASALYSAVKNSHIYNIDMDYEGLDEELISRIAFYLMRNMETFLNNSVKNDKSKIKSQSVNSTTDITSIISSGLSSKDKDEDLIFDGSLLTKAAEHLLENDINITIEERLIIYRSLVDKTHRLREEIHEAMTKLFKIRENGKLSIEGKENLLRFCLLDDSLENIVDIFSEELLVSKNNNNNNTSNNNINKQQQQQQQPILTSRPSMIRKLSSHMTRSQSSDDIIQTDAIINDGFYQDSQEPIQSIQNEEPHIVVADADSVPVDSTTGKRVLIRNFSQTNVHSKKLEEEEGELHRWGFFVQQQNDIMPDDSQNKTDLIDSDDNKEKAKAEAKAEKERLRIEAEKAKQEEEERLKIEAEKKKLKINTIPSGSELRETIMKAKGIESISDLIKKVNKDFTTVEKIYKHVDAKRPNNNKNLEADNGKINPESNLDNKQNENNGLFGLSGWLSGSTQTTEKNNADKIGEGQISQHSKLNKNDNINDNNDNDNDSNKTISPSISVNSFNNSNIEDADEIYERILNNVIRVRSNK